MSTTKYAQGTEVSPMRTRGEIEHLLTQHGATGFGYAQEGDKAMIVFRMHSRHIRMVLTYPSLESFTYTQGGRWRDLPQRKNAHGAEVRRLWRELLLLLKAKLVAIQSNITSFEKEFLGDTLLPDGKVVFEWLQPQLEEAYRSGDMPALLPGLEERKLLGTGETV